MKKFRTGGYGGLIEEIEIERETEKCVFLKTRHGKEERYLKSGSYSFFDSWEAAHTYLLEKANVAVASARRKLEVANSHFGNVKELRR